MVLSKFNREIYLRKKKCRKCDSCDKILTAFNSYIAYNCFLCKDCKRKMDDSNREAVRKMFENYEKGSAHKFLEKEMKELKKAIENKK